MDLQSEKLLKAFDTTPSGATVSLATIGPVEELRPHAQQLVAQGCLRPGNSPDSYERTEDGRMAIAGPLEVTLYTRPGCHLCDEAKAVMRPLIARAGATLREVNIDADAILRERYNVEVPVIFLGARKVAKYHVDPQQFRRQLEDARRKITSGA